MEEYSEYHEDYPSRFGGMPPRNDSQFSMRYNKFGQNYPVKNPEMDSNNVET